MTRAEQEDIAYQEYERQQMADCTAWDEGPDYVAHSVADRHETVCLRCCRMASDCQLVTVVDEPCRTLKEQWCGACRGRRAAA